FEVDLRAGELRRGSDKIKLGERPFQILAALLERPGEVVTREELQRRLWPADTFVDFEHSINTAVNKLREALGDSPEQPRFIETLPRHGYRFVTPVETVVPSVGAVREPPLAKRRIVALACGALVLALAMLLALNVAGLRDRLATAVGASRPPGMPLQKIESIAVLPLENLSRDPEQEYFADGLTDALITDLGKVATLRVISRTSVMHYKGAKKPLPEIARELDVDAVVEGTVQRSGNQVRITAQLLEARADRHLWSEIYERDSGEITRLEEQVALAIAREVSGRLTPAQETRLASNRTTNPRAYDAYLRGRHLWEQRTEEPVAEAVGYFEQALREDPQFALAYSGLADCYSVGWWSKADFSLAEKYARKGLALEPDMAEGHASLGAVDWQLLKWAEGVKECKRAIELNPNYAAAHHFYAIHLLCLGQLVEALAENNRALRLDPFSLPVNAVRQYILSGLRQYDRAVERCEATAAMNPQLPFLSSHGCRARFYWIEGRVPEALADERKAATLAHLPARLHELDEIAAAYAQSGPRAAKLKFAQQLEAKYHKGQSVPLEIACAYGVLGDKGKVVKWLNQSFRDRNDDFTMMLKSAPEFDFVRADPRFQDLLRRANLPP
ncbi:MAG: winged helix-turn-helix domain-containing protein, partial [Acidobacteriia bacterium]|nr:winged helix-turn-helix domain-containing protein [Terriglobia bacterium]